jgi:hypothetical protein
MRIDQAGHHEAPAQVFAMRGGANVGAQARFVPDIDDAAAGHGQRFCLPRSGVGRIDPGVAVDGIRGRCGLSGRSRRD